MCVCWFVGCVICQQINTKTTDCTKLGGRMNHFSFDIFTNFPGNSSWIFFHKLDIFRELISMSVCNLVQFEIKFII